MVCFIANAGSKGIVFPPREPRSLGKRVMLRQAARRIHGIGTVDGRNTARTPPGMDKTLQVKVYDRDSLPTEDVIILVVSVAGCGVDTTYWCKRLIENFIFFYEIFLVFYFSHVLFISLFEYRYG